MCLGAVVIPFLPATNVFFRVGFVIAERVLYLPSAGFCLLVIVGLRQLSMFHRARRVSVTVIDRTCTSYHVFDVCDHIFTHLGYS
jgi:hypothetical protein